MRNRILGFALAILTGVTFGLIYNASGAQASIGYTTHSCSPVSPNSGVRLTVTSWYNDTYTQKTYHYSAVTDSAASFTVEDVRMNGVSRHLTGTLRQEGYVYTTNLNTANWQGVWHHYIGGIPVGTVYCNTTG